MAAARKKLRMAAYCRVSSDKDDQLHSFEAQVDYYTKYIEEHDQYEMAGIYADEAISGTSTKGRKDFLRMIDDCLAGKIDIVITKSISRFARNTQDSLKYMRELRNRGIPIIFEKENINSMDSGGELLFTILSSLAQDESRNISENSKWGIRSKFKKGQIHMSTANFLGYDKDKDGKLVINEGQAETVRRIFREFLWGKNPGQIAADLHREGVLSGTGQTNWYAAAIRGILTNEKHKGDALLQKTYTSDFLTKKQVKNDGTVTQYYITGSHEGIIDREEWDAVQEELARREEYKRRHGLANYSYGSGWNPFTGRVFCGKCGRVLHRHCWNNRGVAQWQCSGHRVKGMLSCKNRHTSEKDLEDAFVKAFNSLYRDKEAIPSRKGKTPLQRLRIRQMAELLKSPPLEGFVPELAQLVLEEVTVLDGEKFDFSFLDGSRRKVKLPKSEK